MGLAVLIIDIINVSMDTNMSIMATFHWLIWAEFHKQKNHMNQS